MSSWSSEQRNAMCLKEDIEVLVTVAGLLRNTGSAADNLMMGLILLPVPLLLLSILLPFHLKFGGEKGKIVMISVAGALFVVGILGAKLAKEMNLDIDAMWENLPVMGTGATIVCGIGIGLMILVLSCRISISIIKKWEF